MSIENASDFRSTFVGLVTYNSFPPFAKEGKDRRRRDGVVSLFICFIKNLPPYGTLRVK